MKNTPASATPAPAAAQQRLSPRPAMDERRRRCRRRAGSPSPSRSPCCRAARSARPAARCRARDRGRCRRTPRGRRPRASGGRSSDITARPSRIADTAMPTSTPGSGTPSRPTMPPSAITIGKVTGKSHSAGAPSCAPQRPTAIIARTWSSPESGWTQAGEEARRLAPAERARTRRAGKSTSSDHGESSGPGLPPPRLIERPRAAGPRAGSSRTRRASRPCSRAAPRPSAASGPRGSEDDRSSTRISATKPSWPELDADVEA